MLIDDIRFKYDDGGRSLHFKGHAGDCVTRAIAIATQIPYLQIYNDLFELSKNYAISHNNKVSRSMAKKGNSPRNGVYREVYEEYLKLHGWEWIPTMHIGQGCRVHLKASELPSGTVICKISKHLCTVIDGTLHDLDDYSSDGTCCVYGYFTKQ